jgi:hypothetical protein
MDARKRKRLEAAGWTVGDATQFLKLAPEEAALVRQHARARSQPMSVWPSARRSPKAATRKLFCSHSQ